MFTYFYRISMQRQAWLLLTFSAVMFEICALFFQHVMKLEPCVMCIYERVALFGVVAAGMLGCIAPQARLLRWLAIMLWLVSAAKGLQLSIKHVGYQFPDPNQLFGPTCDIFVAFPKWAPLNQWMPWLFEATGDCSDILWQFLTLSMPQWLVIVFAGILLMGFLVALSQFVSKKKDY